MEAGRPDTITREKLQVLRDHAVDRISVNPQTMEDHVLRAIGRRHTAADIEATMETVAAVGFPHVNMDLIAGLPEDTPEGFRRSLQRVMAFGTDNLTVHTLSLKKGSRITLEGSRIPTVEEVEEMLSYADPTLRAAGFEVAGMVASYTYGFPVAKKAFEDAGVTLVTLTDYEHVVEEAAATGYITEKDVELLHEWRKDPANWNK